MQEIKEGYTRVSAIVSQFNNFEGIDKAVLERKALIGTRVHEAIDSYHHSMYLPLDDASEPYFESFTKWFEITHPKVIQTEQRFYCEKLKITGQIDLLGLLEGDNKPILIDYKTSASENAKTWPMQGCFYHYLIKESGLDIGDRFLFLKLDKYGKLPKVCEYKYTKDLWDECMEAYETYKQMHF